MGSLSFFSTKKVDKFLKNTMEYWGYDVDKKKNLFFCRRSFDNCIINKIENRYCIVWHGLDINSVINCIVNKLKKSEKIYNIKIRDDFSLFEYDEKYEKIILDHISICENYDNVYQILFNYINKNKNLDINSDEFLLLKELLHSKGLKYNSESIFEALKHVAEISEYLYFFNMVQEEKAHTLNTIIDCYLDCFGDNFDIQQRLLYLYRALSENNIDIPYGKIKEMIYNRYNERKISIFETNLLFNDDIIRVIDNYNGYEFEEFLRDLFINMGYTVENTKLSCDQGADLLIRKYGEKIVVQAKRYNSKVSNSAIQEAVASVRFYSADKAYVVTSNYFTKSACELAQCNNVRLIDRDELIELTSKYYV